MNAKLLIQSRKAGSIGLFEWSIETVKAKTVKAAVDQTFNDRRREYNVVVEATPENLARANMGALT